MVLALPLSFGLDLDNCLSRTMEEFVKIYSEESHVYHTVEEMDRYSTLEVFPITYNYAMSIFKKIWDNYKNLSITESKLRQKVLALMRIGKVTILTNNTFPDKVLEWLDYNEIPYHEFRSNPDWQHDKATEPGIDILIDDKPELVESCVKNGKILFLYDQPWNRSLNVLPKNVVRIQSLAEIPRLLPVFYQL